MNSEIKKQREKIDKMSSGYERDMELDKLLKMDGYFEQ